MADRESLFDDAAGDRIEAYLDLNMGYWKGDDAQFAQDVIALLDAHERERSRAERASASYESVMESQRMQGA